MTTTIDNIIINPPNTGEINNDKHHKTPEKRKRKRKKSAVDLSSNNNDQSTKRIRYTDDNIIKSHCDQQYHPSQQQNTNDNPISTNITHKDTNTINNDDHRETDIVPPDINNNICNDIVEMEDNGDQMLVDSPTIITATTTTLNNKSSPPSSSPLETDPRSLYFKNLFNIVPKISTTSFFKSVDLQQSTLMSKFKEDRYPYDFNTLYRVIFCSIKTILIRKSFPKTHQPIDQQHDNTVNTLWEILTPGLCTEEVVYKLSYSRLIISLPLRLKTRENNRDWQSIEWREWKPSNELRWFIDTIFPLISKTIPNLSQIKLTALTHCISYSDFYKSLIMHTNNKNNHNNDVNTAGNQTKENLQDGILIVIKKKINNSLGDPIGVFLCFNITERITMGVQQGIFPHISVRKHNVNKIRYISPFGCKRLMEINPQEIMNNKTCIHLFIPVNISLGIEHINRNTFNTSVINDVESHDKKCYIKNFGKLMNTLVHMERLGCTPVKYNDEIREYLNNNIESHLNSVTSLQKPNNRKKHINNATLTPLPLSRTLYYQQQQHRRQQQRFSYSPNKKEYIDIQCDSLLWSFNNGSEMDMEILMRMIFSPFCNIKDDYQQFIAMIMDCNHDEKEEKRDDIKEEGGEGDIYKHIFGNFNNITKNIVYLSVVKYLSTWYLHGKYEWTLTNRRLFFKLQSCNDNNGGGGGGGGNNIKLQPSSFYEHWYVYDGYSSSVTPYGHDHMTFENEQILLKSTELNGSTWPLSKSSTIFNAISSSGVKECLSFNKRIPDGKTTYDIQMSKHWLITMLTIFFDDNRKVYFLNSSSLSPAVIKSNHDSNAFKTNKINTWDDNFDDENDDWGCSSDNENQCDDYYRLITDQLLVEIIKNIIGLFNFTSTTNNNNNTDKEENINSLIKNHHISFTNDEVKHINSDDNVTTNNNKHQDVNDYYNKFISTQLKHPHLTHPFLVQFGVLIFSHYLAKSFRCCWFPNTPTTLMKLYNRQNYDGVQPKERVFLMAIDSIKERGVYWVVKFKWTYDDRISTIYPNTTEVFLLYTSEHPQLRKIQKIDLQYLETEILPNLVFFVWPNLLE